MNSIVTRFVVVSFVIGLVAGFLGGYTYKSLDATAPIAPGATVTNSVDSELIARKIALELAPEIAKANGATNLGALPATSTAAGLAGLLLPKAHAQSTCDAPSTGVVDEAIKAAISSLFGNFDDGCQEARITGSLSFEVYGDVNTGEFFVKMQFKAHVTVTALKPDCESTYTVHKGKLNTKINVRIDDAYGKRTVEVGGEPPRELPLICSGSISLNSIIGSIDKKRCPYCPKIGGTETPAP